MDQCALMVWPSVNRSPEADEIVGPPRACPSHPEDAETGLRDRGME